MDNEDKEILKIGGDGSGKRLSDKIPMLENSARHTVLIGHRISTLEGKNAKGGILLCAWLPDSASHIPTSTLTNIGRPRPPTAYQLLSPFDILFTISFHYFTY